MSTTTGRTRRAGNSFESQITRRKVRGVHRRVHGYVPPAEAGKDPGYVPGAAMASQGIWKLDEIGKDGAFY